jgi:hypothetical protein
VSSVRPGEEPGLLTGPDEFLRRWTTLDFVAIAQDDYAGRNGCL